jgi:hypothetical protein
MTASQFFHISNATINHHHSRQIRDLEAPLRDATSPDSIFESRESGSSQN